MRRIALLALLVVGLVAPSNALAFTYTKTFDTRLPVTSKGHPHLVEFTITGAGGDTYATGGITPDATATGLGYTEIGTLRCSNVDGYSLHWTGSKVMFFTSAALGTHTHGVTTTNHTHTVTISGHTHAVAVTAGTSGDAVTNNAGVLESTGGQDLVTESGGASTPTSASDGGETVTSAAGGAVAAAALSQLTNGTSLNGVVLNCTGVLF